MLRLELWLELWLGQRLGRRLALINRTEYRQSGWLTKARLRWRALHSLS